MTLLSSINIAKQSLSVNQAAITTVSNNITNMDTDGYSKVKVNLASVVNYTPSAGNTMAQANSLSGVEIANVQRYSDSYMQSYYRQENSQFNYLSQYSSIAGTLEGITNELNGTGLASTLSAFYTAAGTLANSPNDATARQSYMQQAQNVSIQFNQTSNNLANIKESLVGDPNATSSASLESSQIYSAVQDVNNLLDQIAKVNFDIIKTNNGSTSSTSLLDQRDALVNKLSSLIPITATEQPNGTVAVSLGNNVLVNSPTVTGHLKVSSGDDTTPAIISIVDPNDTSTSIVGNVNSDITSGSIGAVLDLCGSNSGKLTISGIMKNLDILASGFAGVMNAIQNGDPNSDQSVAMALDANGKLTRSTQNLFVSSDATDPVISASNISVNPLIVANTNYIAAARISKADYDAGATTYQQQVGNNTNMTMVSASRSTTYGSLGNTSVEKYLANTVGNVGTQVENLNTNLENQTLVLGEVTTTLQSKIGVNLDEELTDLIKYQRAYQASARIFSVCSDLLGELVNLGK